MQYYDVSDYIINDNIIISHFSGNVVDIKLINISIDLEPNLE
ncbi:MAG: hypothetical protein Satyrvirus51_3, partial [Satyrvirus sp.]